MNQTFTHTKDLCYYCKNHTDDKCNLVFNDKAKLMNYAKDFVYTCKFYESKSFFKMYECPVCNLFLDNFDHEKLYTCDYCQSKMVKHYTTSLREYIQLVRF